MKNLKHTKIAMMVMAATMALGFSSGAMAEANPPDHIYTAGSEEGEIKVGNAGEECAQLGALLGREFVYSYKFNEGSGEGAPNATETANFYDTDGNLVHSNTITILNSNGSVFDWNATNSIGAVLVKAGQGYNVYVYDPQAFSDTGLYGYEDKEVSHVTFCWNKDMPNQSEWCSPGYWRQPQHLDSWEATGIKPDETFYSYFS